MSLLNSQEKIDQITGKVREILDVLGIEWDDSTEDTPKRVAKMYVKELFAGLDPANYPKIKVQENKFGYDQMLVESGIKVHTVCEHHLVPVIGVCHLAYLPKNKIIGLSKFNRIVDYWSRRPQVQERLTEQISTDLRLQLGTDDIAVVIDAIHLCVKIRGIKDDNTRTRTSSLHGSFRSDSSLRQEFYASIPKLSQ